MKNLEQLQHEFVANTFYKGIKTVKNPMDLWVYGEIIHEVQPTVIIEIGCYIGGSALWLTEHSDAMVLGIDIDISKISTKVRHPRLSFLNGDACSKRVIDLVDETIDSNDVVMVIEDSEHGYENTYTCLTLYSHYVTKGSYYIVEDTICPELGYEYRPGEAVEDFVKQHDNFVVDRSREKYITWNPGGFLKRVK